MVILSCLFFFEPEALAVSVTMADTAVGIAFNNYGLSWAGGALTGAIIAYRTKKYAYLLLGPFAGYVAGAAAMDVYEPWQMFLVAAGAPFLSYAVYEFLGRRHMDDHKLLPVFATAGTYGLIMVGLIDWGTAKGGYFGITEGDYAFQHAEITLWWQLIGIAVCFGAGMLTALVLGFIYRQDVRDARAGRRSRRRAWTRSSGSCPTSTSCTATEPETAPARRRPRNADPAGSARQAHLGLARGPLGRLLRHRRLRAQRAEGDRLRADPRGGQSRPGGLRRGRPAPDDALDRPRAGGRDPDHPPARRPLPRPAGAAQDLRPPGAPGAAADCGPEGPARAVRVAAAGVRQDSLRGAVGRAGPGEALSHPDQGFELRGFEVEHRMPAIGYAFVEFERPGRFDAELAGELGVSDVRDFGRLQRGEAVDRLGRRGAARAGAGRGAPGPQGRDHGRHRTV